MRVSRQGATGGTDGSSYYRVSASRWALETYGDSPTSPTRTEEVRTLTALDVEVSEKPEFVHSDLNRPTDRPTDAIPHSVSTQNAMLPDLILAAS